MEVALIILASCFAGCVDAIVGGGGLVLIPALFTAFPSAEPPSIFGTNKSASIWGTSFAAYRFSQKVKINWHGLRPAIASALIGSFFGAWLLTMASAEWLRKLLPVVLLLVLIYTLSKKDMGIEHTPYLSKTKERSILIGVGLTLGLYDGFFGPGTGSFFVFALVRLLGYDFLNASAHAKLLNASTNLAAIALFALKGHVWWHIAIMLALANILGSVIGTRLVLKHGAGFVRAAFIVVVLALICKTGFDAYLK